MKILICVALLVAAMVVNTSECALCKKLNGTLQPVTETDYTCKRVDRGGFRVVFDCSKLPEGESKDWCMPCYTWTEQVHGLSEGDKPKFHVPANELQSC